MSATGGRGLLLPGARWYAIRDGDSRGFALYARHYSRRAYKDGRRNNRSNANRLRFVGPGESLVLLTPMADALFAWRKFINDAGERGVNCAVFRNESAWRSSDLIREASALAWDRWPGERLYTYVNAAKLPPGKRPGYCFEMAGWKRCGTSQGGLLIFELLREDDREDECAICGKTIPADDANVCLICGQTYCDDCDGYLPDVDLYICAGCAD